MSTYDQINLWYDKAICYSGYRDGQSPDEGTYPSHQEILEDLRILKGEWKLLRLYDCGTHAERVLEVIEKENLDFKLMLGAYITAEVSNPDCPWGGEYTDEKLRANKKWNEEEVERLIQLTNRYRNIVMSVSVGNEATVSWTDHMVPVESVIEYVKRVKQHTDVPVTFCENYVPWLDKLQPLVDEVDFISIHTYPVWEYKTIEEGLSFTQENFNQVQNAYPEKPIVITEAGWATHSNGRGIEPENVNEQHQSRYFKEFMEWTEKEGILAFYFEAFDENWKGSNDPLEPEKNWGLYRTDRTPKKALEDYLAQKVKEL